MSEVWWKELRERDPEQWERLTERKNARNNCALMAVFIDRQGGKDINVYEEPHSGEGCVVQFVKGDAKKYGDWEYVDLGIADNQPTLINVGMTYPSVLKSVVPAKTDELRNLGCEKSPPDPFGSPPNQIQMNNCPIKNTIQMKNLAQAITT